MDTYNLGEKISKIRKEKGLTQKELAERIHVSASAVSKWENGTATPDVYTLKALAEVFEISVGDVVNEESTIDAVDKENKTRGGRKKKLFLSVIAVLCVCCMIFIIAIIMRNNTSGEFEARIVDEFLDTESKYRNYETIYHVVIEYEGDLTEDFVFNYPEAMRADYECHFDEAEVIMVTFWKEYKGREHITEADAKTFLLPIKNYMFE